MMRFSLLLCWMLGALLQQAPPARPMASGTGMISGRIVDAATGAPIAGAQLYLHQTRGDLLPPRSEQKDSGLDGTFVFSDLPAGEFEILASAAGYLEGALGKRRADGREAWIRLAESERFDRAIIEMFREARVTGVVVDEHGDPVKNAFVAALRRAPNGGRTFEVAGESPRTDEKGQYRIARLIPGEYVIALSVLHYTWSQSPLSTESNPCIAVPPPPPGANPNDPKPPPPPLPRPVGTLYSELWPITGPRDDGSGEPKTYRTTFYPNVNDIQRASAVRLESGETRDGVDFRLDPVRGTFVRGRIVMPDGRQIGNASELALNPTYVRPERWQSPLEARGYIAKDNTFTFLDLPPGRYTLSLSLATSGGCDAISRSADDIDTRMTIDVPPAGLDDVEVSLLTTFRAMRHIVLEQSSGTKPPPLLDIYFSRTDGGEGASSGMEPGPQEATGFYPGEYIVKASENALEGRWFVASITSGGADLTASPLDVTGPNIKDIVITFTDAPSRVDGTVTGAAGQRVDDATVVAFPIDARFWPRAHQSLMRFPLDRAIGGKYRFPHLIPGEYFLVAVDEREMGAWPSETMLRTLATRATPVRVQAGKALTVPLLLK
jgi:hypothetical protein